MEGKIDFEKVQELSNWVNFLSATTKSKYETEKI